MKVYYGKSFWYNGKEEAPLKQIPVHAPSGGLLSWNGKQLCIPAVYLGEAGAVMDVCMRVQPGDIAAFLDKWGGRDGEKLSSEDLEQLERESPFCRNFAVEMILDGRRLKSRGWCAVAWNPLVQENECEVEELMEEYGCGREYGWVFTRESYEWEDDSVLSPEKMACRLTSDFQSVTAAHFTTGAGEGTKQIKLVHPLSGESYTLTVVSCTPEEYNMDAGDDLEYPSYLQVLNYTVEPDIPMEELSVFDCGEGDPPRRRKGLAGQGEAVTACSVAVLSGCARSGEAGLPVRSACSSLWFEPQAEVRWRAVFSIREAEEFCVEADLASDKQGGYYG